MSADYMPAMQFSPHAFITAISSAETTAVLEKAIKTIWEPNKATTGGEDRRNVEDAIERQRAYIAKKNGQPSE